MPDLTAVSQSVLGIDLEQRASKAAAHKSPSSTCTVCCGISRVSVGGPAADWISAATSGE